MLGWCADSRFAFIVAREALTAAAEALHSEFFGQPDPLFFVPNRASVATQAGLERARASFQPEFQHAGS